MNIIQFLNILSYIIDRNEYEKNEREKWQKQN